MKQKDTHNIADIFFANSLELISILDDNGNFIKLNRKWEKTLGYSLPELKNQPFINFVYPDDRDTADVSLQHFINGREPLDITVRYKHKKGGYRLLECRLFQADKLIYINARDLTEQKKTEEETRKINAELESRVLERTSQLEQANRDLETFSYSISHDLKAPLRHIQGFTHQLYAKIPHPGEEITGYYEKINLATKRMLTMIEKLLNFSQLGRKNISFAPVPLSKVIEDIILQFKPDYSGRDITWNIDSLPVVSGDKLLLRIAFENIISNAIKYTNKKEKAIIEIGTLDITSGKATIFVKDNGAGFDMRYANKLFGVFQRLHRDEEFEGSGIGLANAKQIIQKHFGKISVESKVNEGATFYITLSIK